MHTERRIHKIYIDTDTKTHTERERERERYIEKQRKTSR